MRTLCLCLVLLTACTRTTSLIPPGAFTDGGGPKDASTRVDAAAPDAAVDAGVGDGGPGFTLDGGIVYCGGTPCVCANGIDDDGDGLIDGFDPECTGPFDGDESTFATGFPGTDRTSKCEDCFFDDNAGPGDDGCRYPASCLTTGTPGASSGTCSSCEPTPGCVDSCLARTPNGCDCFGCCEVRAFGEVLDILLNDACSLGVVNDLEKCPRCMPNLACKNPCGTCELCPGKTIADLESSCGSNYQCDSGEACGPTRQCEGFSYCLSGCCIPLVL